MEKKKIVLIVLLLIIIVTTIILVINVYNNQKISEVKKLVEKTLTYSNYYYETDSLGQTWIKKVKDNIVLSSLDGTVNAWKNYNTNESIAFNEGNAIVFENPDALGFNQIYPAPIDYFDETKYKIKYIGKEEIEGKQCVILEFTNKQNSGKNRLWIDEEIGVFYKWIIYKEDNSVFSEDIFKVQLNTITDEDVAKPDMSGYNVLNAE